MAEDIMPPPLPRGQPSPIRIENGCAFVGLGRGFEAVIDECDLVTVAGYKWRLLTNRYGHGYAYRSAGTYSCYHDAQRNIKGIS